MLFFGAGAALGGWTFDRFLGKREQWQPVMDPRPKLQSGGIVKCAPVAYIEHGPETLIPCGRRGGLTDEVIVRSFTITNKVDGSKRLGTLGADVINRGTFTVEGTAELTHVDREALAKLLRC